MGVRARVARMIGGDVPSPATVEALRAVEVLTAELHALQSKVSALEIAQLDEFDSIRAAVAATTDDLVSRVQAIDERSTRHE